MDRILLCLALAAGGFSRWVLKKGYEGNLKYNIKYGSEVLYCIALAVAAFGDDGRYIMVDKNYLMILRCQSSNDLGRIYFLMDGSLSGSISIVQCG